jgi:Zn-dependent protease with chaperone function
MRALIAAFAVAAFAVVVAVSSTPARAAELTPRTVAADAPISRYELPPELRARAEAYAHAHHLEYVVGTAWGLVTLLVLLRLRVAARLRTWATRRTRRRILQIALFAPAFLLTLALAELPTAIWSHTVERRFGLSIQGWASFARDWALGQALGIAFGTFLVWLLYTILRRSLRRWWLWTWLAMLPVLVTVVFLMPLVIEPLFFRFTPLTARDPALAARLRTIAKRGGEDIPLDKMFVMDASAKLRAVNAYVTGLGASKRVVVWDTTLAVLTDREIASVFGHELGHYVLGHVAIGLALGAGGLFLALLAGAIALRRAIARFGPRLDIAEPGDLASLPLILLLHSLFLLARQPVGAAISRHLEHEADAFGLRVIEGPLESRQKRIQESGYLNALLSCYAATATAAPRCSARYSAGVFQPSA